MNRIELALYNAIKNNPRLKKRIVRAYQRVLAPAPVPSARTAYPISVRPGYFFGFHDKCPWSADDRMLLAHRFAIPLRMPRPEDAAEVGFFDGHDATEFHPVARTRAWNWQMGAQLQWVGAAGQLLFNDVDDGQHVARIVDLAGRPVGTLARPVGAVSPDGTRAVCHEFARLRRCASGYGYASGSDPDEGIALPTESARGLSIAEIPSGRLKHLFSVADIARIEPHASMRGAYHYFTHPLFSPSGTRFVFLHRWVVDDNKTWTRLLSCDANGGDPFIFPTASVVSHLAWRDDEHILAYSTVRELGEAYHYVLFRDRSAEYELIGTEVFTSDGHPQFSPDRRWILTDTYPDRFRVQYLMLYDTLNRRRYHLAKLRSPFIFSDDLRCDLHPRWNRAGTTICFDSGHTGERALCTLQVGTLDDAHPPRVV
jgi:hypothetical protein